MRHTRRQDHDDKYAHLVGNNYLSFANVDRSNDKTTQHKENKKKDEAREASVLHKKKDGPKQGQPYYSAITNATNPDSCKKTRDKTKILNL